MLGVGFLSMFLITRTMEPLTVAREVRQHPALRSLRPD